VCLSIDGNRFSKTEHVERRHNELLLPMLSDVFERAGLHGDASRARLDAVAFGRGPGSFTGVRIAAAAAQAIALACEAYIVRVPTSQVMALRAIREQTLDQNVPGLVTFIRSRRDYYYLATYRVENQLPVAIESDRLHDRLPDERWLRKVEGFQGIGSAPDWWQASDVVPVVADAEQTIEIAELMIDRGEFVDPADGLPDYLEGDSPWRKVR